MRHAKKVESTKGWCAIPGNFDPLNAPGWQLLKPQVKPQDHKQNDKQKYDFKIKTNNNVNIL